VATRTGLLADKPHLADPYGAAAELAVEVVPAVETVAGRLSIRGAEIEKCIIPFSTIREQEAGAQRAENRLRRRMGSPVSVCPTISCVAYAGRFP